MYNFLGYAGLTQLLQAAGGLPFMIPIIDAAINNIACSELHPIVHVSNIFAKLRGESGERPTLSKAHNPIEKNQFEYDVNRVVKTCNIHETLKRAINRTVITVEWLDRSQWLNRQNTYI